MCGEWQGALASCSFSMTTDKVLIDKFNHKQKNTQRLSPLPPVEAKLLERKSGKFLLPTIQCKATAYPGLAD